MDTELRGLSWWLLVPWLLFLGGLAACWRAGIGMETALAWSEIGWAAVLASAVYFAVAWLNYVGAALVAALLLSCHPAVRSAVQAGATTLQSESLGVLTLAGALGAWQFTFHRRMSWPGWGLVVLAWVPALTYLWAIQPHVALEASLLLVFGFVIAVVVAIRLGVARRLWPRLLLMGFNCALALAAAGLATDEFRQRVEQGLQPDALSLNGLGFAGSDLDSWCWPTPWIVMPLTIWGVWRSLRRGWISYHKGRIPLPWLLSLYVVLEVVRHLLFWTSVRQGAFLSMATLSILLSVYCVGDLFQGLGERLVLAPPDDQSPRPSA